MGAAELKNQRLKTHMCKGQNAIHSSSVYGHSVGTSRKSFGHQENMINRNRRFEKAKTNSVELLIVR